MEWCGGAARAADQRPRQPRTALAPGTEFRSGVGGHPNPALGTIALSLSPGGLPSLHRRSALTNPRPQNLGFFLPAAATIDELSRACDNPRPPAWVGGCTGTRRIRCVRGL